ncbi:Phosphopentomutase [Sporomusa silvacetica DSM 10669]|uniref:Phosphopentomutase n=1 Tax=Sporomusa silvacetica DSM 10669 TaxID=1123289 RepID=A0ABZ3ILV1_9FIRM|nr:phosphopentomutase [Sporomusa silvacetica]OZC21870.1 phosphopentomutase [Sporomusa silvacetica DSM 10669]
MFKRIFVIVLDSVGIGAMPDAFQYGDTGANTLVHIAEYRGGLNLPVLASMGLGLIEPIAGIPEVSRPIAAFGKMAEISVGKDTTSGHWELAGCPLFTAFPVYPNGFPPEVIEKFTTYTGLHVLGNKAASGTEIIVELGEEHLRTGQPIVYTSADSVFQIAAHEEVIPLERLYELCQIAREKVCVGDHAVGRIIARPFIGKPGSFARTANRHDYSLQPPRATVLDMLKQSGLSVIGIGKIADIYANQGLTQSYPTKSNKQGMEILTDLAARDITNGLIMANLVEFDSVYGHRNDAAGYAQALEEFDLALASFKAKLTEDDLLFITADHGCDPTLAGTDHTREYVPLLAYHHHLPEQVINLGVRSTFADLGATIADNFGLPPLAYGQSFLKDL